MHVATLGISVGDVLCILMWLEQWRRTDAYAGSHKHLGSPFGGEGLPGLARTWHCVLVRLAAVAPHAHITSLVWSDLAGKSAHDALNPLPLAAQKKKALRKREEEETADLSFLEAEAAAAAAASASADHGSRAQRGAVAEAALERREQDAAAKQARHALSHLD